MKQIIIYENSKDSLIRRRFLRMFRDLNVIKLKMKSEHYSDIGNGPMDEVTYIFGE